MRDTQWLTPDEQHLWRSFIEMSSLLETHINRQLQSDCGLSDSDYGVLVKLSEAPEGRLRIFELAEGLRWEKSRLSHHLARMRQRGLVDREHCPTDARGSIVVITDEGLETIRAAAPLHVAEVRAVFFDALDDEQRAALQSVCDAVHAKLAASCDEVPAGN